MNTTNFLKTWEGVEAENKWSRIFIAVLIVTVLFLVIQLSTKDQRVVLQPPTLAEEAWITSSKSSQSYKEAWGLYLAQSLGNVTPHTASFIKTRLEPLLSPSIYNETIAALEMQVQEIKEDRISLNFEPRKIEYEPETDKIFVYGYSYVRGAMSDGKAKKEERTYEYIIQIRNYAPLITSLSTYRDKPRTKAVLAKIAEASRNNNNAES